MMETINRIKEAGLKFTPQRRAVYEVMMELRHAPIDAIIERVQSKDSGITISTVYRVLDSFYKANVLSLICHPDTGRCYYDITVTEHHHLFNGQEIVDYDDPELTELIRKHLNSKGFSPAGIDKIQVQITIGDNK